jgi:hypothetical protein
VDALEQQLGTGADRAGTAGFWPRGQIGQTAAARPEAPVPLTISSLYTHLTSKNVGVGDRLAFSPQGFCRLDLNRLPRRDEGRHNSNQCHKKSGCC